MFKNKKDKDWTEQDAIIEGGNWAAGASAVTLGVWMWIWPHEVHNVKVYTSFIFFLEIFY